MLLGLKMIAITLILMIVFEGTGIFVKRLLKLEGNGYEAPVGAMALFACAEVCFLPVFLFHLPLESAMWILGVLLCFGMFAVIYEHRRIIRSILRKDTLYLALSSVLFVFVLLSGNTQPAIFEEALAIQSGGTAAAGTMMQGYAATTAWLLRYTDPMLISMVSGCLFHALLSAFSMNVIRSFHLKNPWFVFTLGLYALFYSSFMDWMIFEAYMPETWRILVIAIVLWLIYGYVEENKETMVGLIMLAAGAGLFFSDGFDMIVCMIYYCLGVWLVSLKRSHTIFDLALLCSVPFYYKAVQMLMETVWIGVLMVAGYTLFLYGFRHRPFRRVVLRTEDWLYEHGVKIFAIGVPVVLVVLTALCFLFFRDALVPLSTYRYFLESEPTKGYFFLDGRWTTYVLNIFRWAGMIILLLRADSEGKQETRYMYILMLALFVNPLSMGLVARYTGVTAYASAFEIFFNPFTDILLLIMVYRMFEWQVIGQWVLEIFLVVAVIAGNAGSFVGLSQGLFTDSIRTEEIQE